MPGALGVTARQRGGHTLFIMGNVWVVLFLVMIIVLAASFSPHAKLMRLFHKGPQRTIAGFSEGSAAKIVGRVAVANEALEAPLTGRQCVYYEAIVKKDEGEDSTTLIREERGVPFFVEDDTGRALVDPHGATIAVVVDSHTCSGTFADPTAAEKAFLDRHEESGTGWIFNRSLQYREGVLEPGELVAVLGRGVREPDPGGVHAARGYRDMPAMRLRMQSSDRQPLYISDDPSALDSDGES